jgi:hypothetical protein
LFARFDYSHARDIAIKNRADLKSASEKLRDSFSRGILVSKGGNSGTPETQRWLQKFDRCKSRALVRPNQAGDAACQIVVCFEVREDQLLGRDNRSRNREQTAVRTNVNGLRLLLKRFIGEPPVEKDAQRRADAPSAALFEQQPLTRILSFAPKMQPSPQERCEPGRREPQLKNMSSGRTPQDLSLRPLS